VLYLLLLQNTPQMSEKNRLNTNNANEGTIGSLPSASLVASIASVFSTAVNLEMANERKFPKLSKSIFKLLVDASLFAVCPPVYISKKIIDHSNREHVIESGDVAKLSCPSIDDQSDCQIEKQTEVNKKKSITGLISAGGGGITPFLKSWEPDSAAVMWLEEQEYNTLPQKEQEQYSQFVSRFAEFSKKLHNSKLDPATMSFILKNYIETEEPFLRKIFSDYENAVKHNLYSKIELDAMQKAFSSPEVREMYERIMKRQDEESANTNRQGHEGTQHVCGTVIPDGLSRDEMEKRLSEKYSYDVLSRCDVVNPIIQHKWGDVEHVFYERTRAAMNGKKSGRMNQTFCDNLSRIFWALVDEEAIDMTDRNYSLLLYRFGGVNYGRSDGDLYIHWLLDSIDLACFLKYNVCDGAKYSWASNFFLVGDKEYISDKQSSVYADKSPLRKAMQQLGAQCGVYSPRKSEID